MKLRIAICMTALLLCAPLAHAEKFYKWQDAEGVWHYSNKPPKDVQAQALRVHSKPATVSEEEVAAAEAADKAETARELSGADSANCKRVQENLRVLLNNSQVKKDKDGDGQEEILSEDEHLAEVSATRKQVEKFCGN